MYRFGRERDAFRGLAARLPPDEALGMLWLAGRLEVAELQQAVADRLDSIDAGEKRCRIEPSIYLSINPRDLLSSKP